MHQVELLKALHSYLLYKNTHHQILLKNDQCFQNMRAPRRKHPDAIKPNQIYDSEEERDDLERRRLREEEEGQFDFEDELDRMAEEGNDQEPKRRLTAEQEKELRRAVKLEEEQAKENEGVIDVEERDEHLQTAVASFLINGYSSLHFRELLGPRCPQKYQYKKSNYNTLMRSLMLKSIRELEKILIKQYEIPIERMPQPVFINTMTKLFNCHKTLKEGPLQVYLRLLKRVVGLGNQDQILENQAYELYKAMWRFYSVPRNQRKEAVEWKQDHYRQFCRVYIYNHKNKSLRATIRNYFLQKYHYDPKVFTGQYVLNKFLTLVRTTIMKLEEAVRREREKCPGVCSFELSPFEIRNISFSPKALNLRCNLFQYYLVDEISFCKVEDIIKKICRFIGSSTEAVKYEDQAIRKDFQGGNRNDRDDQ